MNTIALGAVLGVTSGNTGPISALEDSADVEARTIILEPPASDVIMEQQSMNYMPAFGLMLLVFLTFSIAAWPYRQRQRIRSYRQTISHTRLRAVHARRKAA